MSHEAKPIGALAKGIVIRAIVNCACPDERRERINIARDCGILTETEASAMIAEYGKAAA